VAKRQRGELFVMCNEESIARNYKPPDPKVDESFERGVDIAFGARFQDVEFEPERARSDLQTVRQDFGIGIGWINESSYRSRCRHHFMQQLNELRPNLHV
jgi:hypothetical protein